MQWMSQAADVALDGFVCAKSYRHCHHGGIHFKRCPTGFSASWIYYSLPSICNNHLFISLLFHNHKEPKVVRWPAQLLDQWEHYFVYWGIMTSIALELKVPGTGSKYFSNRSSDAGVSQHVLLGPVVWHSGYGADITVYLLII